MNGALWALICALLWTAGTRRRVRVRKFIFETEPKPCLPQQMLYFDSRKKKK